MEVSGLANLENSSNFSALLLGLTGKGMGSSAAMWSQYGIICRIGNMSSGRVNNHDQNLLSQVSALCKSWNMTCILVHNVETCIWNYVPKFERIPCSSL